MIKVKLTTILVCICYCFFWVNMAIAQKNTNDYNYTISGKKLKLPEGWLLGEVAAVEVNSKGHIFVFNRGDHKLLKFDTNGNFLVEFGTGNTTFDIPHGLKIDQYDNVWTTDVGSHIVIKFSPAGEVLMVLGRQAHQGTYMEKWNYVIFDQPTDVAIGPDGGIFVTDGYGNSRVVKFDKKGNHLKTWGEKGNEKGQFNLPHTVTVYDKKVYVGDRENKRIQIFDLDGNFLNQWTNTGYPYSIKIFNEHLFSVDGVTCQVYIFDLNGKKVGEFGKRGFDKGELSLPHWLDVNEEGIWIAEVLSWRAQHFDH